MLHITFAIGTRSDLCTEGFPIADEYKPLDQRKLSMIFDRANFTRVILFPGMNFTCSGTIARVSLAGWTPKNQASDISSGRGMTLTLEIRRSRQSMVDNGFQYSRAASVQLDLPSACKSEHWNYNTVSEDDRHKDCILYDCLVDVEENESLVVTAGDILGIKLQPRDRVDWIYFMKSMSENLIFQRNQPARPNNPFSIIGKITVQPVIRVEIVPSMILL